MGQLSIRTVAELTQKIGRVGFAYDFPIETTEPLDGKDLMPLAEREQEVTISTVSGHFMNSVMVKVTDVSSKKLYGKVTRSPSKPEQDRGVTCRVGDMVDFDLDDIAAIEWAEPVVKRVIVRGAGPA